MSLSVPQQKQLFESLYDHIIDSHSVKLKEDLSEFTKSYRSRGLKGIVLLDYLNIKDMIDAVKNENYQYEWVKQSDATKIKHAAIPSALITMNSRKDCILVCSLSLSAKHLYVDCVKFRDISG